ncbi:MAG: ribonuclease Y [Candidatus Levybacteria bacterium RIFCSPHIGHO2_01_FULL_36_15]|nr:MAG: ribonuclease Y [Candidatus Levybacteria bacterium RIFCSPHIGHO2_01_FULL_36_15]OGH39176.1 MAG: ribonuclease Y [Candidatus Levybacteria bacterium RIFCSPLOWO2_01_FULL_36_10]
MSNILKNIKVADTANQNDQIKKLREEYIKKLEQVTSLSRDQARNILLEELGNELKGDVAKIIKESEDEAKTSAHRKAQEILVDAMKHGALDYIAEYTISTIKIPDEDIKGRIIGKEGRNIRAFENTTGVDVDLDEEGIIRLSSFDPVRREVARRALDVLIKDTRIQPVRIEEVVVQTRKEVEAIILEEGEKLVHAVGVYNLNADLVALLGRFKFRTSFGQNLIVHTLEETKIGAQIAHEVGASVDVVKLGCLFHDIGKIVSDKEGSHVKLGADLLSKYKMPREVVNCVLEHHEDKPFSSIESVIVYIADAISGARPGARHEDYEEYLKRLREMEEIAKGFNGVEDAYAFEAGRELRVIINPGKLDDIETTILAKQIKDEIDKKLIIPGVVRVTAIREFRVTEPKE